MLTTIRNSINSHDGNWILSHFHILRIYMVISVITIVCEFIQGFVKNITVKVPFHAESNDSFTINKELLKHIE